MSIDRHDLAAWIVRTRPDVWDLAAAREAGDAPVPFALRRTYRAELVATGDPVLLWVGGSGNRGIIATGVVTAPASERTDPRLWRQPGRGSEPRPYVDIDLDFLDAPVTPATIRSTRALRDLEILRVPRAPNPSVVTAAQLRSLRRLVARAAAEATATGG